MRYRVNTSCVPVSTLAIVAGGAADGAEEFDFEITFGLGDLVGEEGSRSAVRVIVLGEQPT